MTSIEMNGASLSIMKLDEELEELLISPCRTPTLTIDGTAKTVLYTELESRKNNENAGVSYEIETQESCAVIRGKYFSLENIIYMVDCMSECIIKNEKLFCELDAYAGDGDFGMSVAKGFRKLKEEWKKLTADEPEDIGTFLNAYSIIIMEHCGGASGPLWGSAFRAAGMFARGKKKLDRKEFALMLSSAVEAIQRTGKRCFGRGVKQGDKTLIDALIPCLNKWKEDIPGESMTDIFRLAAAEAVRGAENTANMVARMGRAGTVGERSLGHPDAGAYALGFIFHIFPVDLQMLIRNNCR